VDEEGRAKVGEDRGRFARARRRVGGDAGVERLAGGDGRVQRAHRLLERRVRVGPVRVEDVDVVEAHPLERLVEARGEVLAGPEVAVGPRPHVVAGLCGNHEFVAERREVAPQVLAEVGLGAAVRRPVVVGKVDVRHTEIESAAQDLLLTVHRHVVSEVLPEAERDCGQQKSTSTGAAVGH
jgi:hypothetical protein